MDTHDPIARPAQLILPRLGLVLSGLAGASAVALSAWAAHGLRAQPALQGLMETATAQQQVHALALLGLCLAMRQWGPNRWWQAAWVLLVLGLLLFSVNITVRVMTGWDATRALVPWGGSAWILAWLALALGAWRARGSG
ncbi:MAG: hypothetical protein RIQ97_1219 [Pseudomonadota bacterium]|jgi:uncharacterized membrane protein YgdD (TMEM256/DUF423 family)